MSPSDSSGTSPGDSSGTSHGDGSGVSSGKGPVKSSVPSPAVRRVAVIGGTRIPFARSDGPYATASNQDMLTAALDGLVERYGLGDPGAVGEFVAGAVLKHSRDFNLARETVLGSKLDARTPAYDIQQACGTGLQAVIAAANKIALGQTEAAIAGGADTASDAPLGVNDRLRRILLEARRAKSLGGRVKALSRVRPAHLVPDIPRNAEPRTKLSMGEHAAVTARAWGSAARPRTSSRRRVTSGWRRRTNAASSRTWSCPSGGWTGTRICAPARRRRNSPR